MIFITGNENKRIEVAAVFAKHNIEDELSFKNYDLVEVQGNSHEIVVAKCREVVKQYKELENEVFFVEDTSLHLDALNGQPGPYIKWFERDLGLTKLVEITELIGNNNATAISTVAIYNGGVISIFDGVVNGIVVPPKIMFGFGFDPIFQPYGERQTFSQMDSGYKYSISYRTLAVKQLIQHQREFHS